MATKKPLEIIVRRGAVSRFNALKSKTADLPVVVSWDRRKEDRRGSRPASVPAERRSTDRRKKETFTWDAADFVVVRGSLDEEPPASSDE